MIEVKPKNVGKNIIPNKQHRNIVINKVVVSADQGLHSLISRPSPVNVRTIVDIVLKVSVTEEPMVPSVK